MKLHLLLLFMLLTAIAQAQRPANSPPPAHISRDRIIFAADFTGAPGVDDLLIIDRATGTFIVGSPGASPEFIWSQPTNLGVTSIDSAALAHFINAGAWSVAVTDQLFNRVQYVPLDGSEPPASIDPGEILPVTLVGFDTGGGDFSSFIAGFKKSDTSTPPLVATHPGGLFPINFNTNLWRSSAGANPRGALPVYLHPSLPPAFAFMTDAASGGGARIQFFSASALNGTLITSYTGLPANAGFTAGQFDADLTNISEDNFRSATTLAWSPTDNLLRSVRLTDQDNSGVLDLITVGSYNLGRPIKTVRIIEETVPRLLVAWADATGGAALYDYDGRNPPVLVGPVELNGMDLDDVIPVAGGDFILIGDRNGSPAYDRLHRSGNSYTRIATGSIPTAPVKPLYSNIIAFNGEPFVNPNAKPVSRKRVPDWTANASYTFSSITLSSLLDGGATAGLGNAQPAVVTVPGTTTHALPNQIDPATSITLLDAANTANQTVADVVFSHPSGSYAGPLTITIRAKASNQRLHYQVNNDDWQHASFDTATLVIESSSFVRAYASAFVFEFGGGPFSSGGQGPIRSASYTIATPGSPQVAANTDANHNGLSDAWENLTGITDPAGDADGDGFLNLQEHNFGTDPGSAASNPGITAVIPGLGFTNNPNTLTWDAGDTAVILETSNNLGTWVPVTTGISSASGQNYFTMPVNQTNRQFYRLRR